MTSIRRCLCNKQRHHISKGSSIHDVENKNKKEAHRLRIETNKVRGAKNNNFKPGRVAGSGLDKKVDGIV